MRKDFERKSWMIRLDFQNQNEEDDSVDPVLVLYRVNDDDDQNQNAVEEAGEEVAREEYDANMD